MKLHCISRVKLTWSCFKFIDMLLFYDYQIYFLYLLDFATLFGSILVTFQDQSFCLSFSYSVQFGFSVQNFSSLWNIVLEGHSILLFSV